MADTDVLDKPDTLAAGPASAAEAVKATGLTPRPEIKGASQADVEAALANQNKVAEETTAKLKASQAQHEQMAQQRTAIPGAPKLQNVPQPPPKFEYQDTMQVFQSPAVLLAALGSVFTRAPLTAAMKAGAAAMEGFHNGQKEVADLHLEQWKAATDYAIKQNQVEMQRYNAIMENSRLSIADKQARMQAIAAANQDQMMIAATSSGNVQRTFEIMHAREQAQDSLVKMQMAFQQKQEAATQKKEANISPEAAQLAADAAMKGNYELLNKFGRGTQGPANLEIVMHNMAQMGATGEQLSNAKAEQASIMAGARALGTREANLGNIANAASNVIPLAVQNSNATNRSGTAIWNKATGAWDVQMGDPAWAKHVASTNTVINLYARAIGGGQMTVSAAEHAREMLNPTMPPAAYNATIQTMKQEIDLELKAPGQTMKQLLERRGGGKEERTDDDLSRARKAIARGADPEAVMKRLQDAGIDASKL
jgi:hypothetical protein